MNCRCCNWIGVWPPWGWAKAPKGQSSAARSNLGGGHRPGWFVISLRLCQLASRIAFGAICRGWAARPRDENRWRRPAGDESAPPLPSCGGGAHPLSTGTRRQPLEGRRRTGHAKHHGSKMTPNENFEDNWALEDAWSYGDLMEKLNVEELFIC